MRRVVIPSLRALMLLRENLIEDDLDDDADDGYGGGAGGGGLNDMVGLNVIAAHLVDWTDPRKLIVLNGAGANAGTGDTEGVIGDDQGTNKRKETVNTDVHLNLAADLLERICSSGCYSTLSSS